MYKLLLLTLSFLLTISLLPAQVFLDGQFGDWDAISTADADNNNDAGASNIDFTNIKFHSDQDYFYLYFETNKEINLQDANKITLYLDTDNNASTGISKAGIGADLEFRFGDRYGIFYDNNGSTFIEHPEVGMISSPTVTSDVFELLLRRDARINGNDVFPSNDIKIVLKDEISSGDAVPDASGGLSHTFNNTDLPDIASFNLSKSSSEQIRFLSYNVRRDDLFEPSKYNAYARIFRALQADVIGIQEVYDNSALQVRNIISQMMGSSSSNWFYDGVNSDVFVMSRYPIEEAIRIDGNAAFLINKNGQKILFVVAHLPCCNNDTSRQEEVDRIMAFIRDAKSGSSSIELPNNTPIVITGDMNLVGKKRQLETFINGDLFYSQYGNDFNPDWDGSNFEDAIPATTGMPASITWNNSFSDFWPGRLDYLIYSGSVMTLENQFALNTASLSQEQQEDFQLQSGDTGTASDHLPIVGDFSLNNATPTENIPTWAETIKIRRLSKSEFELNLALEIPSKANIQISNALGQIIFSKISPKGTQIQETIDLSQAPKSIYFVSIEVNGQIFTNKIMH